MHKPAPPFYKHCPLPFKSPFLCLLFDSAPICSQVSTEAEVGGVRCLIPASLGLGCLPILGDLALGVDRTAGVLTP